MSPLQSTPVPARRASWRIRAATTRARTSAERVRRWRGSPTSSTARHGLDLADEVDAVDQRAAQPPLVAGQLDRRAAAAVRRPRARAAVAGRHDDRVRRELERPLAAHDLHAALLERLAQRVHRDPRELRQLVEEEHAAVGERDLARHRPRPAAHEPLRRDRVVRGAERALGGEPPASDAGRAVDLGDLERLLEAGRRQDSGQPPGEHGLARAGRPDHQQVVAAGGGDLERALGVLLPAHVGQVRARRAPPRPDRPTAGRAGSGDQRPCSRSASRARRRDGAHLDPLDQRRLGRVRVRNEQAPVSGPPGAERGGERAPRPGAARRSARARPRGRSPPAARAAPGRWRPSRPTAMARSKLGPALRTCAGARFTVSRF